MKSKMKIHFAFAASASQLAGCGTLRRGSRGAVADNELQCDAAETQSGTEIHRRIKPLERPQVRFSVETAVHESDSCLADIRIVIPHRPIRRRESFSAALGVRTPEGAFELPDLLLGARRDAESGDAGVQSLGPQSRSGKIRNLYCAFNFCRDAAIEPYTAVTVQPVVCRGRYVYDYAPATSPVCGCADSGIRRNAAHLPQTVMRESSPLGANDSAL